jgi:hypothetical protein
MLSISQAQLVKLAGISTAMVSAVEGGYARDSMVAPIRAALEARGVKFFSDGGISVTAKSEPFTSTPAATPDAVRKAKALLAGSRRARGLPPEFEDEPRLTPSSAIAELAAAESRLTGARLHLEQILPRYHRSTAGAFAETYYVPRRLMERRLRDMAVENSAALKAALAKRADNNDERDPNPMPADAPGPADMGDDESPSKPKDKSKKNQESQAGRSGRRQRGIRPRR